MSIQDGKCDSPDKTQLESYACELYKENKELKKELEYYKIKSDKYEGAIIFIFPND